MAETGASVQAYRETMAEFAGMRNDPTSGPKSTMSFDAGERASGDGRTSTMSPTRVLSDWKESNLTAVAAVVSTSSLVRVAEWAQLGDDFEREATELLGPARELE